MNEHTQTLLMPPHVVAALVGMAGAFIGFLLKVAWDRIFSDRTCPMSTLLERFAAGKAGSAGKRRLALAADDALRKWAANLSAREKRPATSPVRCDSDKLVIRSRSVDQDFVFLPSSSSDRQVVLWFKTSGQAAASVIEDVGESFAQLADWHKLSGPLIAAREFEHPEDFPVCWVLAPRLILRSPDEVDEFRDCLQKKIHRWLPFNHLVIEVYLAEDLVIAVNGKVPLELLEDIVGSQKMLATSPASAARAGVLTYIDERQRFREAVLKGDFIEEASRLLPKPIPREIVAARLEGFGGTESIAQALIAGDRPVHLSGPPGSGKTDTAYLLCCSLRQQAVVVQYRSAKALRGVIEAAEQRDSREVLHALTKTAASLLPVKWRSTELSEEAFADALVSIVTGTPGWPLVMVVDDLHEHSEVREAVEAMAAKGLQLPLRFLLSGRSRPLASLGAFEISLGLFSRDETRSILEDWLGGLETANLLSTGWVQHQERFSRYLINCVYDNAADLSASPSDLLIRTIRTHVGQLSRLIDLEPVDYEALLQQVRAVVAKGGTIEQVSALVAQDVPMDPVELIGRLSWMSRFHHGSNAILTPQRLIEWSGNSIPSLEAATRVFNAGSDLEIFDLQGRDATAAIWKNTLISDGCAALSLKRMTEEGSGLIGEMLRRLKEANSLEIISLVLDTATLIGIMGVSARHLDLHEFTIQMVTPQFLNELNLRPDWVNHLAEEMRHLAHADRTTLPVAVAVISKLLPLSTQLSTFWSAMLGTLEEDGRIALALRALEMKHQSAFFTLTDAMGLPKILSTDVALSMWGIDGSGTLVDRFIQLHRENILGLREIDTHWMRWCADLSQERCMRVIRILIDLAMKAPIEDTPVFRLAIARLLERGLKASLRLPEETRSELAAKAVALVRAGRPMIASEVVRWVAYELDRDLAPPRITWIVDSQGTFALPSAAYPEETLPSIFIRVYQNRAFDIPHSNDLRRLPQREAHIELVSDRFPDDRSSLQLKYDRWNLAQIDGEAVHDFVGQLQKTKILWRPKLLLEKIIS